MQILNVKCISTLILFLGFCIVSYSGRAQSASANSSLNAPFEPITRITIGLERGIGYGGIENYNFNGVRSIVDFVSYKFDFALGITQSEIGKNALSINTVITKNVDETNIDDVAHFGIYTGMGYTKLYFNENTYTEQLNVPLGLSLGLDGPLPSLDINLSLSFRGQYRLQHLQETEHSFGFGINVGGVFFPSGDHLGVRINYDFLNINQNSETGRLTENGLSLGFQYILY